MRPRERAGSGACQSSPRKGACRRRSRRPRCGNGPEGARTCVARRRWRRPWRHELAGDRCRRESDIACLAQVDDSGDGNGHVAVGATNGTVALGERFDHNILNAQVVEADGDRADIDDGVDGAHLVEHDGLGRFAVGLGLGGSERGEDGEGATFCSVAQLRAVDDGGDVCQRAVVMVVGVMVTLVAMTVASWSCSWQCSCSCSP